MRTRYTAWIIGLGLAASLGLCAQAKEPAAKPLAKIALPRTPDGHPDLQDVIWTEPYMAVIEPVPTLPTTLVLSEEEAKAAFARLTALVISTPNFKIDAESVSMFTESKGFPLVRGERRSRLLVSPADGKIPFTVAARRETAASQFQVAKLDNPEDRPAGERCLTQGAIAPIAFTSALHPMRFVQTPTTLALEVEYGDELRVIPMTTTHGPWEAHPQMGDSIAHWDGDTLVIETTNFPAWNRLRAFPIGLITNSDAKVTERFTRLSLDELLYQFTIEDPKVYTGPWMAEFSFYRANVRMFPSGCHEGNYSLPNILGAAREDERLKALAKK